MYLAELFALILFIGEIYVGLAHKNMSTTLIQKPKLIGYGLIFEWEIS
jgi:hypothetical protein